MGTRLVKRLEVADVWTSDEREMNGDGILAPLPA